MSAEIVAQEEECQLKGRLAELELHRQKLVSEESQALAARDATRKRHESDQLRLSLNGQLGRGTAIAAALLYLSLIFHGYLLITLLLALSLMACLACYYLIIRNREWLDLSEDAFEKASLERENLRQALRGEISRIEAILACLQDERSRQQREEEDRLKALAAQTVVAMQSD